MPAPFLRSLVIYSTVQCRIRWTSAPWRRQTRARRYPRWYRVRRDHTRYSALAIYTEPFYLYFAVSDGVCQALCNFRQACLQGRAPLPSRMMPVITRMSMHTTAVHVVLWSLILRLFFITAMSTFFWISHPCGRSTRAKTRSAQSTI